jgi:hypothetical protein
MKIPMLFVLENRQFATVPHRADYPFREENEWVFLCMHGQPARHWDARVPKPISVWPTLLLAGFLPFHL